MWCDDQEQFWSRKRRGDIDLPGEDELAPALIEVLRIALQPDPAQRYQRVNDLVQAIRHWQGDAAADGLCRTAAALISGNADLPYDAYVRASALYEQAVAMRPDFAPALAGRIAVRRAHAGVAMRRGDLALAAGLLHADDHDLATQLVEA